MFGLLTEYNPSVSKASVPAWEVSPTSPGRRSECGELPRMTLKLWRTRIPTPRSVRADPGLLVRGFANEIPPEYLDVAAAAARLDVPRHFPFL